MLIYFAALFRLVALIEVIEHGSFVGSIQSVPFLPVVVRHPHLLPLIDIFEILTVMARVFQQVTVAEDVVIRCNWGFERPFHLVIILLYFSPEQSRLAWF